MKTARLIALAVVLATACAAAQTPSAAPPESREVVRARLLSHLQDRNLVAAAALGEQAIARWPQDAGFRHWLGLAYFQSGRKREAIEQLALAAKLNPSSYDVQHDLALVYLAENRDADAATHLERARRLNPRAAMDRILLGRAYQNTNRTVKAVEEFRAALRIDPKIPLGHYHLGFAYGSLGRNAEAIAEYEKELVLRDHVEVRYQIGHTLLESGEWRRALEHLRRAAELAPRRSAVHYHLGKAQLLLGDAAAAIVSLRRAIDLDPNDASAHFQLARALEKSGEPQQAQQHRARFAELKKLQQQTGGMATGRVRE